MSYGSRGVLSPLRASSPGWEGQPLGTPTRGLLHGLSIDEDVLSEELHTVLETALEEPRLLELDLSRHRLCHDAMVMLMDVVAASPSLNLLRLDSVTGMDDNDFADLCEALQERNLTTLLLSGAQLTPACACAISDLLATNHHIHTLDLSRNHLARDSMRIIEDGLDSNSGLRTLDLSHNALATRDCERLCDIIQLQPKLSVLDISGNRSINFEARCRLYRIMHEHKAELICDDQAMVALLAHLGSDESPTSLSFANTDSEFDPAIWKTFTKELKTNSRLRRLSLAGCNLKAATVRVLAGALRVNSTLIELDLTDNPHVRAACKALATSMMASNGMRVLTLVNCRLTAVEASYLAEYLQAKSCALEELDLKDNAIGGKGAVSLLKGLQHNHRLKSLVLSSNEIKDGDAHELASLIATLPRLEGLSLYQNAFSWSGRIALAGGTLQCQHALSLEMERASTATTIAALQQKKANFQDVQLEYSALDSEALTLLLDAMCLHQGLKTVNLRGEHLNEAQSAMLLQALKANPQLHTLNLTDAVLDFSVRLKAFRLLSRRSGQGLVLAAAELSQVKKLHATCENDPSLETLTLTSWQLDGDTAVTFAQGLRYNTHLTVLSMDVALQDDASLLALFGSIRMNKSLKVVSINAHKFSESVAAAFGHILEDNQRIASFELSHMFDHVAYPEAWLPMFASARNLRHLGLQKAVFDIEGSRVLNATLRSMPQLESLNLDHAAVPSSEAHHLQTTIEQMGHLKTLSIQHLVLPLLERIHIHMEMLRKHGNLKCTEMDVVARLMAVKNDNVEAVHCRLEKVDLHGAIVPWLCEAIANNTHLQCLEFQACKLSDGDAAALLLSAVRHPRLRELVLDENDVGRRTLQAAGDFLSQNYGLVKLGLKGLTEQLPEHCKPLVSGLARHPTLLHLRLTLPRCPELNDLTKLLSNTPWQPLHHARFEQPLRRVVFLLYCINRRLATRDATPAAPQCIPVELLDAILSTYGKLTRNYSRTYLME